MRCPQPVLALLISRSAAFITSPVPGAGWGRPSTRTRVSGHHPPTMATAVSTGSETFLSGVPLVTGDGGAWPGGADALPPLVALFFSAGWCPDCQTFLPKLREAYGSAGFPAGGGGGDKAAVEVVFVSSDPDEDSMRDSLRREHGAWPAIPQGHPKTAELKRMLKVCAMKEMGALGIESRADGVPTVAVLRRDGTPVTLAGVADVLRDGAGAAARWEAAAAAAGVAAGVQ